MQLTPRYLISNKINVVVNLAGFITEYRPVYQRQIQVYKGIDNVLQFRLLNANQRPIDVYQYIPKFVAFDSESMLIIERDGQVLDDGSTLTARGLFTVTLTEQDLFNIKQQYLKYNIYLVDINDNKIITYSHSNFDNDATILVNDYAFPGPKDSLEINNFHSVGVYSNEWVSDPINAESNINNNEALHTLAIYSNQFQGDVIIQATLSSQLDVETPWADIAVLSIDSTENTKPVPINVTGVYEFMRLKTVVDPSDKISKVLIRN